MSAEQTQAVELVQCSRCPAQFKLSPEFTGNGEYLCGECRKKVQKRCVCCGKWFTPRKNYKGDKSARCKVCMDAGRTAPAAPVVEAAPAAPVKATDVDIVETKDVVMVPVKEKRSCFVPLVLVLLVALLLVSFWLNPFERSFSDMIHVVRQ